MRLTRFYLPDDLHREIGETAAAAGHTVSEEIRLRCERRSLVFADATTQRLADAVALVVQRTKPLADANAYRTFRLALEKLLANFDGNLRDGKADSDAAMEAVGFALGATSRQ